jgi:hypothetical protein
MSKSEECDRCGNFSGYEGESFLVCAMHPAGPETTPCPDWDLVEDDWFPCGVTYVDGELVLAQADFLEECDRNIEIIVIAFAPNEAALTEVQRQNRLSLTLDQCDHLMPLRFADTEVSIAGSADNFHFIKHTVIK